MIATTKEQSARLLQCGVPAKTADMCLSTRTRKSDGSFVAKKHQTTNLWVGYPCWRTTSGDEELENVPAWSLSRLMELLPKEIDIDGYPYRIGIYFENPNEPVIGNQWCLFYKPKKNTEKSHYIDDVPMYAPDLIECAVLMVEWLTRHNYKLNEI